MKARDNLFATHRVESLLEFDPGLIGSVWETLEDRWEALGRRACVVGHHGSGKTSFLNSFSERLGEPLVRFFFSESASRLRSRDFEKMESGRGVLWIVDGDRHLAFRDRRLFYRAATAAGGFLSARHRCHGLPPLLKLRSDVNLAEKLYERIDPGDETGLKVELPKLYRRHRGNLRHLWLSCYDRAAGLER
ncbi:MAG: hypothetical protein P1U68_02625 [Verrucomicrobiales bacterium]|nr:hypothetical protein [Verrucomicrobiales bacterium]